MNGLQHDAHVKTHFEGVKFENDFGQWRIDRDNRWLREEVQDGVISPASYDIRNMPKNQQLDATWLWDKFGVSESEDEKNMRRYRITARCIAYRATKRKMKRLEQRAQKVIANDGDYYLKFGIKGGIARVDRRD